MSPYTFETPEFGLDEEGLHRLRSRFPFENIAYSQLSAATITRGKSVQNWAVLLLAGIACIGFSAVTAYRLYQFLAFGRGHFYVETLATPFIPGVVGVAAIWQALQVTDILVVRIGRRRLVFPLETLKDGQSTMALASYLAKRVPR